MSFISHVQYDSNGTAVPVPMPTTTRSSSNKFGNFPNYTPYRPGDELKAILWKRAGLEPPVSLAAVAPPLPPPPLPTEREVVPYKGTFRSRMEEWSYLAGRNQTTNPAKFHADNLNKIHAGFLANGVELDVDCDSEARGEVVDLEQYMLEVFAYLERDHEHDDVLAFLLTIQGALESGTFCPEGAKPKFSTKLNTAWKAYQRNSGISATPAEQREAIPPDSAAIPSTVVVGEKIAYKALKKRDNRAAIVDAYSGYIQGTVSESTFFAAVRKFCLAKVSWKLKDYAELGKTAEDIAQEMVLAVIKNLPNFKGTPDGFYSFLNRTVYTRGLDAIEEAKQEEDRHAFLLLIHEDGEERGEEYDNPLIYPVERPQYRRKLPEFIQGDNLRICQYIRENYSYAKIAQVMSMTLAAVKQRVLWMRKTIEEMRARGEKV